MASIEFVCGSGHPGENINRDGPTITLHEGRWAYCRRGGVDGHSWEQVTPTTIAELTIGWHRASEATI
jgi:hypothetical protein